MRKKFYFAYNKYKLPRVSVNIEFPQEFMNGYVFGVDLEQFIGEPNSESVREQIIRTIMGNNLNIRYEDIIIEQ